MANGHVARVADQAAAVPGGLGPGGERVARRGEQQGGRPVPRGHLLLTEIRANQRQGEQVRQLAYEGRQHFVRRLDGI